MALKEDERRHLEAQGPDLVRSQLVGGVMPHDWIRAASEYLGEYDAKQNQAREAAQAAERASDLKVAKSAQLAAWIAAIASVLAAIFAAKNIFW